MSPLTTTCLSLASCDKNPKKRSYNEDSTDKVEKAPKSVRMRINPRKANKSCQTRPISIQRWPVPSLTLPLPWGVRQRQKSVSTQTLIHRKRLSFLDKIDPFHRYDDNEGKTRRKSVSSGDGFKDLINPEWKPEVPEVTEDEFEEQVWVHRDFGGRRTVSTTTSHVGWRRPRRAIRRRIEFIQSSKTWQVKKATASTVTSSTQTD